MLAGIHPGLLARTAQSEALTEAPFIRPDGVIVAQPGYDAPTRTFYAPVGNMEGFFVQERPTANDIDCARSLIEDALGEFPFVDQASRANAFGLFITPEVRPAIIGNIPMGLADAPQAGSGKTLLVSIVSEKTSGSAAAMRSAPIRTMTNGGRRSRRPSKPAIALPSLTTLITSWNHRAWRLL
jgi:hypothetical protein